MSIVRNKSLEKEQTTYIMFVYIAHRYEQIIYGKKVMGKGSSEKVEMEKMENDWYEE